MTMWVLCAGVAALFAAALWRGGRRTRQLALGVVIALSLAGGGYAYWFTHRPVPPPTREVLFEGITYERVVRSSPRPLLVHVATIDLDAPGIKFVVTPRDATGQHPLRARTTSRFLQQFGVQLAINGDFFHPWYADGPFDFYPHVGDPVSVRGLAIAHGETYSLPALRCQTLFVTADGRVSIGTRCPNAVQAISGGDLLVAKGEIALDAQAEAVCDGPQPRTAVVLDASERKLLLVVVDGRQPNFSEGVTLRELAELLRELGAVTALNLDGGGSSALVTRDAQDRARVLNSPIHGRFPPGRERPVANHLGIYAHPTSRR